MRVSLLCLSLLPKERDVDEKLLRRKSCRVCGEEAPPKTCTRMCLEAHVMHMTITRIVGVLGPSISGLVYVVMSRPKTPGSTNPLLDIALP